MKRKIVLKVNCSKCVKKNIINLRVSKGENNASYLFILHVKCYIHFVFSISWNGKLFFFAPLSFGEKFRKADTKKDTKIRYRVH